MQLTEPQPIAAAAAAANTTATTAAADAALQYTAPQVHRSGQR
jgi:hypothetical protein